MPRRAERRLSARLRRQPTRSPRPAQAERATATATVTVVPAPPPPVPTVTLTANPTTILAGGSSDADRYRDKCHQPDGRGHRRNQLLVTRVASHRRHGDGQARHRQPPTRRRRPVAGGTATGDGHRHRQLRRRRVTITANPPSIASGSSSTLTVTATNATSVTVTGTDGSSYTLAATGGTQSVSPRQPLPIPRQRRSRRHCSGDRQRDGHGCAARHGRSPSIT